MNSRWFVDVTYTRTRKDVTGITRTVTRLLAELQALANLEGGTCEPIIFHGSGFRLAGQPIETGSEDARQPSRPISSSRYIEWISGRATRRVVTVLLNLVPWFLLKHVWMRVSSIAYNGQSSRCTPVRFRTGDVLFIADASWNYPVWQCCRLASTQGARVVTLIYDLMPVIRPDFCYPLLPRQFQTWLSKMIYSSDAMLCISKATQCDLEKWISEHHKDATKNLPIGHFRLGVDPIFTAPSADVREFIHSFVDSDIPYFAAIGSFELKRNYELVLQVFENMWKEGFSGRLLLAGRKTVECSKLINRLTHHPELGGHLLVLHDASDSEIISIYQSCRALIMPSLFEGFGLPLIEARTSGCMVIANALPSFIELADDGVSIFDGTSAKLKSIVAQHAALDRRGRIKKMSVVSWKDAALECKNRASQLLQNSQIKSN